MHVRTRVSTQATRPGGPAAPIIWTGPDDDWTSLTLYTAVFSLVYFSLLLHILSADLGPYVPRGVSAASECLEWDPRLLSSESVNAFLLEARRVHTGISMAKLFDLVRDCKYDLEAARFALVQPMIAGADSSVAPAEATRDDDDDGTSELNSTMARLAAHRRIKQTAQLAHEDAVSGAASVATSAQTTTLLDSIAKSNEQNEQRTWNAAAATAKEAITAALQSLVVPTNGNGIPSSSPPPAAQSGGRRGKKDAAAANRKNNKPVAASPTMETDAAAEDASDDENGKDQLDDLSDAEDAPSAKSSAPVADPSFLYPWLQFPGFPTRTPAPMLIEVTKLRDIVQIITDAADAVDAHGSKPGSSSTSRSLHSVSSAHLSALQHLLSSKNEWLDRARPVLNQISRNRDNQTLDQVLQLLRTLELDAPAVDSRERRKFVSIVTKAQEWRVRCQVALKQAAKETHLPHQGLLQYAAGLPTQAPSPVAGQSTPAAAGTAVASDAVVPFTLPLLTRLVKECDRACGCVATEESGFLRVVHEYTLNFVRQIEMMLECRIDRSRPTHDDDETNNTNTDANNDMEVDASNEEESAEAQRRVVEARATARAAGLTRPDVADAATGPLIANDYPREAGTLPAKIALSHAKLLLHRFRTRYRFHFDVPQATLLEREIHRCEQWLVDAQAALRRQRRSDESIDQWLQVLTDLYSLASELPIAIDPLQLSPLLIGLRGRIWSAKVDQVFTVDEDTATAAADGMEDVKSESKPVSARRGPTLQGVKDLLDEAAAIPVPATAKRYIKLQSLVASAQALIGDAAALLGPKAPKVPLREWHRLLSSIRALPVHLDEESRIDRVLTNTSEWHKKASAILLSSQSVKAPHAIPFHEVELLLHKTNGKSIALISDSCEDPQDNSATFAELNQYLTVGRSWCQEVSECFTHLSTASTRKSTGGSATAAAKKAAAAAANAHEHMDRYATMERLKQLLGLYTYRDAENDESSDEESTDKPTADQSEEKEAASADEPTGPAVIPATTASESSPSPTASVSLPSTDPSSWSWLSRYGIAPATFELLLPHLGLKMADSLSDRLSLVSECLAMAWNALRGPKPSSVLQLQKLVHQLRQSGELDTAEPLRTLQARLRLAVVWRAQARKALPIVYLSDIKRKQRRRVGRDSVSSLIIQSPIHMRTGRRTRKKSGPHGPAAAAASASAADGDADEESDADEEVAAHSTSDLFQFSDDEDEDAADEKQPDATDADASKKKTYRSTLAELQQIQAAYQRFVDFRKQQGDTESTATGATSEARPTTPNTSASPSAVPIDFSACESAIHAALRDGPSVEYLHLGLDLVELDECEALEECIEECVAWQEKARETLAHPSCVALTDSLQQAQPLFHEPKLPAVMPSAIEATATPAVAATMIDIQSAPVDNACITLMRDVLSETDDQEVFIPEMEQLAHLSWARDWIQQAQQVLVQCERGAAQATLAAIAHLDATPATLIKDEPMSVAIDTDAAAAPVTAADDATSKVAADPAEPLHTESNSVPVPSPSVSAPSAPSLPPVSLDSLVSLLRGLRTQFGSAQYTPLLFHMQVMRTAQRHRPVETKEESEGEEEEEEPEPDAEQNEEEEKKTTEANDAVVVKVETTQVAVTPAAPEVAHEVAQEVAPVPAPAIVTEPTPLIAAAESTLEPALPTSVEAPETANDVPIKMEVDDTLPHNDLESTGDISTLASSAAAATAVSPPAPAHSSPSSSLPAFLSTFQHDIQHIEYYLYELLHYSHRIRQLFERRLGAHHTNLLLGPPREEILIWLAEAADAAGINTNAERAAEISHSPVNVEPNANATSVTHDNLGSGLLATCRRLSHLRARDRSRQPAARLNQSTPAPRRSKAHSPAPTPSAAIEALKREKSEPRRRIKKERKDADDDDGMAAKAKRGRKGKDATPTAAADTAPSTADASADAGDDDGGDAEDDQTLYCLCQRPYVEGEVMIGCDVCSLWFHTSCLSLSKADVKRADELKFLCPSCAKAAKKPFRYRDKVPHRKAKSRGPKLTSLIALSDKIPTFVTCEEIEKARGIMHRAQLWTREAEEALANPPTEPIQLPTTQRAAAKQTTQAADPEPAVASAPVEPQPEQPAPSLVEVADAPQGDAASVVAAPVEDAEMSIDTSAADSSLLASLADSAADSAAAPIDAASVLAAVAADAQPVAVAPAAMPIGPTRRDVENILKLECTQRELWLKTRMAYTDRLSDALRVGMGLPLEIVVRKPMEERIRLLLNLEKAERILLDNVTVPLLPSAGEEEAEVEIALAAAAAEDEAAPATATPAAAAATPKEREQTSLTPHARRHDLKEIGVAHSELQKCSAGSYIEPVASQNIVWSRFDSFFTRLQAWIEKTNHTLYKATGASTLHALMVLQTEYKNHFLMVVCPAANDLTKRLANVVKWIPRERKAIAKRYRAAQLWKLQLDRVGECGITTSPCTLKIQSECARTDDWMKRLHWSMDHKQGPQHFKSLLAEATEGPSPVLVDMKDVKLCQGFTELYCLCQVRDGRGVGAVSRLDSTCTTSHALLLCFSLTITTLSLIIVSSSHTTKMVSS